MLIPDDETAVDFLNYEAISRTVVKLLKGNQERPLTIGIHGGWGAGKSSILKMIESEIEQDDDGLVCLRFNGWAFQGFEDAKIVLIQTTINELCRKRSKIGKVKKLGADLSSRVDWFKMSLLGGGIALSLMQFLSSPEQVVSIASILSLAKSNFQALTAEDVERGLKDVTETLKPKEGSHVVEHIHQFREDFEELLKEANIKQLVILIDDLDRCLPSTAINTLEAIRLFLFVPRTAFVIGADEAMIEYSVRQHFPELPIASGPMPYARNYLEKLIQVPFRIPALGIKETTTYVTLLLIETLVGTDHSGFEKLLRKAKEGLSQPWLGTGVDSSAVESVDPGRKSSLDEAYVLAQQIGPILAEGTKGNPRQVKRFLNSMMSRQAIASAKGFGDSINQAVLAKLMLAEQFQPDFYEFLAAKAVISDQGVATELILLEKESAEERKPEASEHEETKGDVEVDDPPLRQVGLQWLDREWLKQWLQIEPQLAAIDLRPYIFAARDKRILAGAHNLGNLEEIIEQLSGPRLAIRSVEPRVKDLEESEATQVFEALKERILRIGEFTSEPEGFHGMSIVAKHHPRFQTEMLSILSGLEAKEVGIWAVKGWTEVLTTPTAKKDLMTLLSRWKSQNDNPLLQKAAEQTLLSLREGGE